MRPAGWAAVALAVLAGGWMVFDGMRALAVGDYVTVGGELGPWADVVEAVGVDPRATGVKALFVAYGAGWLAAAALFARGARRSRALLAAFAAGALPYLVAGTLAAVAQLVLLVVDARRPPGAHEV